MAFQRLRRALLVAGAGLVLAACGGGDVASQLNPARLVAFGDGAADQGQTGARYTINDGSNNVWVQQLAVRYGRPLTTSNAGGLNYAAGNARVVAKPDAAGNAATRTVNEQISAFLAAQSFGATDLVVLSAGTADVVAEAFRASTGAQSSAQALANVRQAGRDMGAQVRRLVSSGARYVVVVGPYNLGRSPWARSSAQVTQLTDLSGKFNEELLVSIVDLGANVLYVDAAFYFNLVYSTPTAYNLTDSNTATCTSVDPGPGIGIGTGQVNSARCNTGTLLGGIDAGRYLFADGIYLTPVANRLFGDQAFDRIRARW